MDHRIKICVVQEGNCIKIKNNIEEIPPKQNNSLKTRKRCIKLIIAQLRRVAVIKSGGSRIPCMFSSQKRNKAIIKWVRGDLEAMDISMA